MRTKKMKKAKKPIFNDGYFTLYHIVESEDTSAVRTLEIDNELADNEIWFEELSVSDRLRSQLDSSNIDIALKIRIPQYRKINSMCVLKIGEKYFKVYNAYHFTDDNGYYLSDLTLTNWEGDYE